MDRKKDCKKESTSVPEVKLEIPTLRVESAEPESFDTDAQTTSKQTERKITNEDNTSSSSLTHSKSDSNLSSDSGSNQTLFPPTENKLIRSTSFQSAGSKKKIVHFADTMGLDLAEVKRFKQSKAPKVPVSAFADLKLEKEPKDIPLPFGQSLVIPGAARETILVFRPQFQQPGADAFFMDKLREQKVCLENIVVNDDSVTGYVRTLNLGFEKLVQVRYSTDFWLSYEDRDADYLSSDGFSDKFTFKIELPNLYLGAKLVFSIRYVVNGEEFWDNNYSADYVVKCVAEKL